MSVRSLNKVQLIGNLTRDPELRYTPSGTAVCTFGLATNRSWTTEAGEKKEETEFHRIVAWNKLADLCSQLLTKGRKVYVEGRLQTRSWQAQDGSQRQTTEVVIDDMIILDSKRDWESRADEEFGAPESPAVASVTSPQSTAATSSSDDTAAPAGPVIDNGKTDDKKPVNQTQEKKKKSVTLQTEETQEIESTEDINPDEIPF